MRRNRILFTSKILRNTLCLIAVTVMTLTFALGIANYSENNPYLVGEIKNITKNSRIVDTNGSGIALVLDKDVTVDRRIYWLDFRDFKDGLNKTCEKPLWNKIANCNAEWSDIESWLSEKGGKGLPLRFDFGGGVILSFTVKLIDTLAYDRKDGQGPSYEQYYRVNPMWVHDHSKRVGDGWSKYSGWQEMPLHFTQTEFLSALGHIQEYPSWQIYRAIAMGQSNTNYNAGLIRDVAYALTDIKLQQDGNKKDIMVLMADAEMMNDYTNSPYVSGVQSIDEANKSAKVNDILYFTTGNYKITGENVIKDPMLSDSPKVNDYSDGRERAIIRFEETDDSESKINDFGYLRSLPDSLFSYDQPCNRVHEYKSDFTFACAGSWVAGDAYSPGQAVFSAFNPRQVGMRWRTSKPNAGAFGFIMPILSVED